MTPLQRLILDLVEHEPSMTVEDIARYAETSLGYVYKVIAKHAKRPPRTTAFTVALSPKNLAWVVSRARKGDSTYDAVINAALDKERGVHGTCN